MLSDNTARPRLLAIETAGSACSVAVSSGTAVLALERQAMRYGHGEALLPMIDRVVAAAGVPRTALDGVAVAVGPGGFTGIRVGLGAARGIALALNAKLIGVTSFLAVAASLPSRPGFVLVALDSRREDLYVQPFDGATAEAVAEPTVIAPDALVGYIGKFPNRGSLLVAGDAVESAAGALGAHFEIEAAVGSAADARGVVTAALRQLETAAGNRTRPLYLRPPDATLPRARVPFVWAR